MHTREVNKKVAIVGLGTQPVEFGQALLSESSQLNQGRSYTKAFHSLEHAWKENPNGVEATFVLEDKQENVDQNIELFIRVNHSTPDFYPDFDPFSFTVREENQLFSLRTWTADWRQEYYEGAAVLLLDPTQDLDLQIRHFEETFNFLKSQDTSRVRPYLVLTQAISNDEMSTLSNKLERMKNPPFSILEENMHLKTPQENIKALTSQLALVTPEQREEIKRKKEEEEKKASEREQYVNAFKERITNNVLNKLLEEQIRLIRQYDPTFDLSSLSNNPENKNRTLEQIIQFQEKVSKELASSSDKEIAYNRITAIRNSINVINDHFKTLSYYELNYKKENLKTVLKKSIKDHLPEYSCKFSNWEIGGRIFLNCTLIAPLIKGCFFSNKGAGYWFRLDGKTSLAGEKAIKAFDQDQDLKTTKPSFRFPGFGKKSGE